MQNRKKDRLSRAESKDIFFKLFRYIFKDSKFQFLLVIILVMISSFVGVISSLFIKNLIDNYIMFLVKQPSPDYGPLLIFIFKMIAVYITGILSTYLYARIMVNISSKTLKNLRNELFVHIQSLPIRFFDENSHGNIMSRFTNDINTLDKMISQSLPGLISSAFTIVSVIVAMIYSSIIMTIVVLVTFILMLFIIKKVSGKSSTYFIKQQQMLGKTNGYIEEMINGQNVIKVFSHEKNIINNFEKINDELAENTMLANRYSLFLIPIVFNMGNLQYALIAIIGGLLAIKGYFGISIGIIAAFLQLSKSLGGPMRNISQQMNSIIMALAGGKRIFEILDENPEEDNGNIELVRVCSSDGVLKECENRTNKWAWKYIQNGTVHLKELKGDIVFNNVSFSYDGINDVLHNINLYANAGQKVAFVGETGAGKTTITNLINRFYDIQHGSITYDGFDIKDIKKHSLRKSLGMVLQDTNLFTGTIKYNLSYGNPDATMEEIIEGAKKTQSHNFISLLPESYNTVISPSASDLSQGQAQLLSIGRTEIYDPPVLILDEATSSIDTLTEKLVQNSMTELMKGRTNFVIAHRLSTVQDADVIIVLSHGRIIEKGSHNDLMKEKGTYYKLYTSGLRDD